MHNSDLRMSLEESYIIETDLNFLTVEENDLDNLEFESKTYVRQWEGHYFEHHACFLLTNNCFGVMFKDRSKIVYHPQGKFFQYIGKAPNKNIKIWTFALSSYPHQIHEKVKLLQNFRSYLEGKKVEKFAPDLNAKEVDQEIIEKYLGSGTSLVHVRRWMFTERANLLILSNGVIQVIFNDQTELIFQNKFKVVTYVNLEREKRDFTLKNALYKGKDEMVDKIIYVNDILYPSLINA